MKTIALVFALVFVAVGNGLCHTPSDITAVATEQGIEVRVDHSVGDPSTHYVKKIVILSGEQQAAQQEFTSQTDSQAQIYVFDLASVKKGDTLAITAFCSKYGELKRQVAVQ